MAGRFVEAGLERVSVETRPLIVRDPVSVDNVMGLRSWARAASVQDFMADDGMKRWETLYDEVVAQRTFRWSVTCFITSGRKPGVRRGDAAGRARRRS